MSINSEVPTKQTLLGKISIGIAFMTIVMLINEFIQIVPAPGILLLSPLLIAPVGLILGLIPLKKSKDNLAKWGVILNIILFLFPFFYMILGTLIGGV